MSAMTKLLLPLALAAAITACSKPADTAAPAAAPAETAAAPADAAAAAPAAPEAAAIQIAAGTYKLDPSHTDVLVQWSHMGFSNPSAHFGNADGTLVYDAADVSKSSVEVTLPLSGLNTFTAKFDEHIRSADFFDAAKFPTATFKSTKVVFEGDKPAKIEGNLTLKGITKPVTLTVTSFHTMPHPMVKKDALGANAFTTVKRTDFNMGKYAPHVGDEVRIDIAIEAIKE